MQKNRRFARVTTPGFKKQGVSMSGVNVRNKPYEPEATTTSSRHVVSDSTRHKNGKKTHRLIVRRRPKDTRPRRRLTHQVQKNRPCARVTTPGCKKQGASMSGVNVRNEPCEAEATTTSSRHVVSDCTRHKNGKKKHRLIVRRRPKHISPRRRLMH